MTAATMKYIDILDYVRKAKEIKDPELLAEYQARQIESAIELVAQQVREEFHSRELATKTDLNLAIIGLKKDISDLRYETLKFVVWTGVGVVITLSSILGGLIARGFHWI